MNYGFVKVAAAVPHVKVADCFYNIQQIEGLSVITNAWHFPAFLYQTAIYVLLR